MAAAAVVLRSENCLNQPNDIRYDAQRRNRQVFPNLNSSSRRRRQIPSASESKGRKPVARRIPDPTVSTIPSSAKSLTMGKVTILKRGEQLPVNNNIDERKYARGVDNQVRSGVREDADSVLCSSGRLGPDPEAVRKQILASGFYAGLTSPDPSSLPFPSILPKKEKFDAATSQFLRLLRLDLS